MPEAFWDKVTNFKDEPVVECDVPAVKSSSLQMMTLMMITNKFWLVYLMY